MDFQKCQTFICNIHYFCALPFNFRRAANLGGGRDCGQRQNTGGELTSTYL